MKWALLKYGFKAGFRDVTYKQKEQAALAGAIFGVVVTCVIFGIANGS